MQETVVYEGTDPCPYLEGKMSKTPLRHQFLALTPEETDHSFSNGDRRVGKMLYHTECPSCQECEPIRIDVNQFRPSKSQRRVMRKNADIRVESARASFSDEKLLLYNRHKTLRSLNKNETQMQRYGYENWFLRSCLQTREFRYIIDGKLAGISILDFGQHDISSVYFYFDPQYSERSLGTFSALFEMQWMRENGMRYYYLGLFVEDCSHLSYKSRFYPHQRRIDGEWRAFSDAKMTREQASVVSP